MINPACREIISAMQLKDENITSLSIALLSSTLGRRKTEGLY
jgi:hypothetical protein